MRSRHSLRLACPGILLVASLLAPSVAALAETGSPSQYPLGLIPSPPGDYPRIERARSLSALPTAVDLSTGLPPVSNQRHIASCVGFAIGSNTVSTIAEELIEKGYVTRPYLGISVVTVTPAIARNYNLATDKGAMVSQLASGSPASEAGMRVGDVIIRINGQQITTADDVVLGIRAHSIGDRLEITYIRGSSTRTASATLIERPSG